MLHIAINQVMDSRMKHIDIMCHFIKDNFSNKKVEIINNDE